MDKILKQSSYLFLAQLLGRGIGFFYTIYLARNLGVEDFGLYSAALAYFSLTSAIADFGFNRFLVREVSRDHQKIPELLCNIGILRLTLTSVIFAIFALTLFSLDPDKFRVGLVLLAILAVLPQSIAQTIDAIFVSLQKLQYSSLALVLLSLVTTTLGVSLVHSGYGPIGATVALILGQLVYLGFLGFLLKKQKIGVLAAVEFVTLKKAILGSLPYGILGVLGLLYFRVDLLLLTYIKGNFDAGIYGAAYKFLEAVVFVPSALATALFPVLARLHDQNSHEIKKIYWSSIKLMGLIGFLIAALYIFLLPAVVKLFLPNYLASIEVIQILALSIPFIFIHVPGAQVLLSTDKYLKPVLWLSVVMLSFNVILNLILIPRFGVLAAAWITVASEILSFAVFFSLLKRKIL